MTQETKNKISKSMTGRKRRRKFQNARGDIILLYTDEDVPKGFLRVVHNFDDETRHRMSEEARARGAPKSAYRPKNGEKNPMFGKKQSEEAKWKISESLREYHKEKKN